MNDYAQSEQLAEIHTALSKAQSEMGKGLKDSNNPFYKSKYASLSSVWSAISDALAINGLSITHHTEPSEKGVMINTVLRHKSGQYIESGFMFFPAAKLDPQGFGSALTYARRYQLSALVGVCTDDDDGNAASHKLQQPQQPKEQYTLERASSMIKTWIDGNQQPDTLLKSIKQKFDVSEIVASYITFCLTTAKIDKLQLQSAFNALPAELQDNQFFIDYVQG